MVILIGGASCTGKTTMAQRLLEKYKIPYLSIDHLKMGLIRGNKYCDFLATDGDDELTEKLWPIVKGIIMTNIENDQNIIIEGCYLPTDRIRDFEPEYLEHIITLYIGFTEQYIMNKFMTGIIEHRSETEYKDVDDYMAQAYFVHAHKQQKTRCEEYDTAFFEIKEDYGREMQIVYNWIDEQVEKKKSIRFNGGAVQVIGDLLEKEFKFKLSKMKEIKTGASGAKVYRIDDRYVLKHEKRSIINNEVMWNSFQREYNFYTAVDSIQLPFVPKLEYAYSKEDELVLLLKQYKTVKFDKPDDLVIKRIIEMLAEIHSTSYEELTMLKKDEETLLNDNDIMESLEGWRSVLAEHKSEFEDSYVEIIAGMINEIVVYKYSLPKVLVHGDFHCNNILFDEADNPIICDWQNVGIGEASGDLSFLMSRALADGTQFNEDNIIKEYCSAYEKKSSIIITEKEMKKRMSASNLLVTFRYWHNYLHGNSKERVGSIYDKMVEDYKNLLTAAY